MESDIRYYRHRALEEMEAAKRAVTGAARERRLQLVDVYTQRLEALQSASRVSEPDYCRAGKPPAAARRRRRSAFAWPDAEGVTG